MVFLIRVFDSNEVNFHRILGSIAVYILIALVFSIFYSLLNQLQPASFKFSSDIDIKNNENYKFLYFSFVTLCTLDYGEITPATDIARSASVFEAMIGVLYPTILIASLVGMAGTQKSIKN